MPFHPWRLPLSWDANDELSRMPMPAKTREDVAPVLALAQSRKKSKARLERQGSHIT